MSTTGIIISFDTWEESEKQIIKSSFGEGMKQHKNVASINVLGWTMKDINEVEHLKNDKITMEEIEVGR